MIIKKFSDNEKHDSNDESFQNDDDCSFRDAIPVSEIVMQI